jgi:hypothetical protein
VAGRLCYSPPPGLKVNVWVRKTSSDLLSRRFQLSD